MRNKTLLLNAAAVILLILTLYVISSNILLAGFANLEDQDIRRNVQRALNATTNLISTLNSKAGDWSNWDDAYQFVESKNPTFIQINAGDKTFSELQINILLFARSSGEIIYAREFDLQNGVALFVPPVFERPLPPDHPFLQPTGATNGQTGILMLPRGPLIFAARPVLTTEGTGPIHGVLMMGRYFDDDVITRLAEQTNLTVAVERFDDPELSADFSVARAAIAESGNIFVQPLSEQSIAGYIGLRDIYDQPAVLLRVEVPRVIYAQGQTTMHYLLLSLVIVGLVFGVATQLLAQNWANALLARQAEEQSSVLIGQMTASAATPLDLRSTVQMLADELGKLISADGCYITLWDPVSRRTIPYAAYGELRESYPRRQSSAGEATMTESVLNAGHTLIAEDVFNTPYMSPRIAANYPARSLLGVPLIVGEKKLGAVLIGFNRSHHFPPDEVARAERATRLVALSISKARLFEDLKQSHVALASAYESTLEGWARALELRDRETEGHSRRVTEMTLRLARAIGMPESELVHIRRGALLHDIGKMGIPDNILLKPGPLSPEEWHIMRQHPIYAFDLLSPIEYLQPALEIPYCHHEKWDGTGYPRGLKGEQIPLAARIFAIVDVWDALSSDRPYRAALSASQVIEYLRAQAGKHFDPQIVEASLRLLD